MSVQTGSGEEAVGEIGQEMLLEIDGIASRSGCRLLTTMGGTASQITKSFSRFSLHR